MKTRKSALFLSLVIASLAIPPASAQQFTPATQPATSPSTQPWPKGEILKFSFDAGPKSLFPGTTRDVWIYIPAQYDATKPACLYVDQDRIQFNAPTVFDQLIAAKEMPVTIAVFVAPGIVKATSPDALARYNRSYEFDGMSPDYANFLLNELLPEVEKQKSSDGRAILLSKNPDDRMIGGSSSGAIASFTVAWERNDSFHRVFSSIGTYVNLRGGDRYRTYIRKFEPKPIRIFLQDGSNDNNHYGGDWWMAAQETERALTFAGYEVNHVWGTGKHDHVQADQIFPDAMRWLWKDWPAPVKAGAGSEKMKELLIDGEGWKTIDIPGRTDGPAVSAGEVFFCDTQNSKICKLAPDGSISTFADNTKCGGLAFGPDGKLYAVSGSLNQLLSFDAAGKPTVITDGIHGNDLTVAHNGNIYITESGSKPADLMQVWLVQIHDGKVEKKVIETGLKFPNGVCLSPDQSLLYVDDYRSHWVYSYQLQPDGTPVFKQRYYNLQLRDADDDTGADGMRVDREGRLYVATRLGIQVCDQAGRVNAIIPVPNGKMSNLTFGGPDFDTLYVTSGDKIFARKLKVKGLTHADAPIKPTPPKL